MVKRVSKAHPELGASVRERGAGGRGGGQGEGSTSCSKTQEPGASTDRKRYRLSLQDFRERCWQDPEQQEVSVQRWSRGKWEGHVKDACHPLIFADSVIFAFCKLIHVSAILLQ